VANRLKESRACWRVVPDPIFGVGTGSVGFGAGAGPIGSVGTTTVGKALIVILGFALIVIVGLVTITVVGVAMAIDRT